MVGMGLTRRQNGELTTRKNVVATFKELPNPSENEDKLYFVKGKVFRHKRGFYYSDGKKWRKT